MSPRPAHVRFLLGPAGSGKTCRCLAELRAALRTDPDDRARPLILLAPKQATFQLERQLLADTTLPGYARLHILSFERLAEFGLTRLHATVPRQLNDEGRVMVLRALLSRLRPELSVFHATARLPGFARQLSRLLREFQQHNLTAHHLHQLVARVDPEMRLRGKLQDLARLLGGYHQWLEHEQIEDPGRLLSLATEALRARDREPLAAVHADAAGPFRLGGLWLDGFAEMTPQELDLIAAVLPFCEQATLAFCLDQPAPSATDWLSAGALVNRTVNELRGRLEARAGILLAVEQLAREPRASRFLQSPELAHLERHWSAPTPWPGRLADPAENRPIRLVLCANPEAEARFAAQVIRRFVREQQGRFRDAAVVVRSLEPYHAVLRRVFAQYEIPIFLDRRESAAHHPLAELSRYALRLAAFGWPSEDWFGALKTGLVEVDENVVDRLENAALARGWRGDAWLRPLTSARGPGDAAPFEALRQRLIPPFEEFTRRLAGWEGRPTGPQLAEALSQLWQQLHVGAALSRWSEDPAGRFPGESGAEPGRVHLTVGQAMHDLLDNLALAFASESLPLREWLAILEAGLANLTVGVVPPALDQVLVGAIDRSRNPDLKLVLVLGLNEGGFPAPIPLPLLLTEAERAALEPFGLQLGPDRRRLIGRERYYAYIACTRARHQLVVSFAERDADDRSLRASPFVFHLQRLFPDLHIETPPARPGWAEIEHACEVVAPLLRLQRAAPEGAAPLDWNLAPALARWRDLGMGTRRLDLNEALNPALAEQLYGPRVLRTSVSRLEDFAACPFRFLIHSGLRAEERRLFEVDVRHVGSFQHEVLARFHATATAGGRAWRDLSAAQARDEIGRITEELQAEYSAGLFQTDAQTRFAVRTLTRSLQTFVATVVDWMRASYAFDPTAAEWVFGGSDPAVPAWELDLDERHRLQLEGKIDRIDLARDPGGGEAFGVVIDYKSSSRKVDPLLLEHGIQIQLPAYLAALRQIAQRQPLFGVSRLQPVGAFYVSLRGSSARQPSRREAFAAQETARQEAYQHRGRFNLDALPALDRRSDQDTGSGQFSYPPGGKPNRTYKDPLPAADFTALLDRVEQTVGEMGRQIFGGVACVSPFLKGASETACQTCAYRPICRFDPWIHEYRRLRPAAPSAP